MIEQREPSEVALKWAEAVLDRIERQERPGLPIWANNPANVYDLAFMFDAFASLIHPPGEVSEDAIVEAARQKLIANSTPCPKCGEQWGLIARCAAEDCPSTEARLARFRELLEPTAEQAEYFRDLAARHVPYDPNQMIGGPSARAAIAPPELHEGHDRPCHYCGERCNALAGNASLWPVLLPLSAPGKVEPAHMRCVMERLRATTPEREALRIAREAVTKFLEGDYEAANNAIAAAITEDQK